MAVLRSTGSSPVVDCISPPISPSHDDHKQRHSWQKNKVKLLGGASDGHFTSENEGFPASKLKATISGLVGLLRNICFRNGLETFG
jgi:hypothetical protein